MKKMIITCALIAAASVMSYAQNAASATSPASANSASANQAMAEHMAEKNTKMYEKQLGLSAEQTKKVHDLELANANQMMAIRSQGGQPGEGQMMQLRMGHDQQMKNILTPDQFTKYQSIKPVAPMRPAGVAPATAPAQH
jgi:Spy/CpxP family protein refolding chaperone